MIEIYAILVLCVFNLFSSTSLLVLLIRQAAQDDDEEPETEQLLLEKNLNSRLRYLQTAKFGVSMVPHDRGPVSDRKNSK